MKNNKEQQYFFYKNIRDDAQNLLYETAHDKHVTFSAKIQK